MRDEEQMMDRKRISALARTDAERLLGWVRDRGDIPQSTVDQVAEYLDLAERVGRRREFLCGMIAGASTVTLSLCVTHFLFGWPP
jgi:hypothetical protein